MKKRLYNIPFLDKGLDVIEGNYFDKPTLILCTEDFLRFKEQFEGNEE